MITIKSRGQLGNQLFQFAFGYNIAQKFKTFFVIDKIDIKDSLNYFELKTENSNFLNTFSQKIYSLKLLLHPRIYKIILNVLQLFTRSNKIVLDDDCWETPLKNIEKLKEKGVYKGYFQSFEFFRETENDIRQMFTIKKKHQQEFDDKFGKIFRENKTIVIHIRRNDYLKLANEKLGGEDFSLPACYYQKALEDISKTDILDNYHIIFVGDDLDFIKSNFSYIKNTIFASESEIIDFQILKNADIAIIANSTFAWWASFLNEKTHKRIIAPKYWIGFKVKKEFSNGISNYLNWDFIEF
jgi:hypothetical protein